MNAFADVVQSKTVIVIVMEDFMAGEINSEKRSTAETERKLDDSADICRS